MIDDIQPPVRVAKKQTPQKIAQPVAIAATLDQPVPEFMPEKKKRMHSFRIWPTHLSKKKQIVLGIGLFLLVVGVLGGVWLYQKNQKVPAAAVIVTPKKPVEVKPTTVASPLTGMQIAPELSTRPVTGVMIENSPDARPQSGLKDAGVVYEAVAEGGITRFLALFQEAQPDYIGPVRSSRPYYLDFLLPFDAAYAHAGGSPEALAQIKSLGVKDMDQFANGGSYQRITSRYAPHNLYTSMAKLDELKTKKGYTTSTFTAFPRATKEVPSKTITARSIDMGISGYLYNVHYDYDATTNSYLRSEGGKPHTDERSGAQLAPKVTIALVMPRGIASDGTHTNYQTVGSGTAFVFQNGTVTQGTWTKTDRKAQFTFTDSTGAAIKLNPGQTWITMVNTAGDVNSKP